MPSPIHADFDKFGLDLDADRQDVGRPRGWSQLGR